MGWSTCGGVRSGGIDRESLKGLDENIYSAQRGARTHDPEIKSLMLYRLS